MPARKPPATLARILTAAADHIEHVGLYQGERLWKPGQMGDNAPCTVLHAWDQGVRAVKPHWSVGGEPWDLFARALWDSLEAVSNHINGRPVPPVRWQELGLCENAYRRTMLWCWGDEPGRTAPEAAAAFRTAAELRRSDRDHAGGS